MEIDLDYINSIVNSNTPNVDCESDLHCGCSADVCQRENVTKCRKNFSKTLAKNFAYGSKKVVYLIIINLIINH